MLTPLPSDTHRVPLGAKPVIKQIGLNVHGQRRVERYVMDGLWSLHVYRWQGTLRLKGKTFPVRPGHVSVEPPNTPLVWRYDSLFCPHYYVHFKLPGSGAGTAVRVVQDLGEAFTEVCDEMERLIALHASHPLRAEVRFWDLLLRLSSEALPRRSAAANLPYAVQTAVAIIENELGKGIEVAKLAARVGISHNQLIRLFRRAFGTGVARYIRGRRMAKTRHLLERTNLPVKAIAAEVGVPNLQRFNKLVRKETGRAPTALRGGSG